MNRFRNERGQTLVISVLFLLVLCGMAAAVIDVGSWFRAQRATQAAADAAALAGAQALPYDPSKASFLASDYSTKNDGGLDAVTFTGDLVANDTINVEFHRPAPGIFSKIFGMGSVTLGAKASAATANLSEARWVAPIVVNEKHPMLKCNPKPCFGTSTELDYYHLKTSGTQNDGAGSFGFINLDPSISNPGSSTMGEWIRKGYSGFMPLGDYDARSGNPFSSTSIGDSLDDRIGSEILFPVYRTLGGTGSNAKYEIIGWVGFYLTGFDLQGSSEKLYGYFTQVIWEGIQSQTNSQPDFGARAIALVQ
jgi:hypothetical protein